MGQMGDVLSYRALNRAMLARQYLLAREQASAKSTITHLVGLQAQAPNAPYVALWSRLTDFKQSELIELITSHEAVRIPCLRGTIHLVTAEDARLLRPLTQVVLTRAFSSQRFARNLEGLNLEELLTAARELLAAKPMTKPEITSLLGERWPGYDANSIGYAVSYLLPLVQVPPRGLWGQTGPVAWALAEPWLGAELDQNPAIDQVVLRYFAAFGPATVADLQTWSGLTRLREIADRLRPGLRTFRDSRGAELFDLPDAPRPDEEMPAPPRFLPEYDNILFSYADRARVNPAGHPIPLAPGNGGRIGTFLLDGTFEGSWRITVSKETAVLKLMPFKALSDQETGDLVSEGRKLLCFAAAEAASRSVLVDDGMK